MSTAAVEDEFDPSRSLSLRIASVIATWAHIYPHPDWLVSLAMDVSVMIEREVILNTIDLEDLFKED